ncbi:patatin-like protein [Mycobacterium vicinigordonae]|uniref:Patatin-like protein n=1 Tax=Mycobacterium vicinigordonae TaxID=1719132 RepID=A0A7D6E0H2_9MYCO|nr:patatin-like protein [Mycobacterium vicinigordonae]QLL06961.1 patatin-like protein [Mycobacterium vicinigordonae]
MAFDKPSPVTELTQELRLATTMTGGVSLAVWMAGVAREINLLAQASQWRRQGGPFPADSRLSKQSAEALRLYAGLIDLLDMIVDVDVLSGTSAGGINAALLASSRISGADLGGLRDLWLDLGALTDLLRDPRDEDTPSLLYGDERMYAALATQIPRLETGPFPPAAFTGGPRTPSTTLYVTTTLLAGETSRFTDSFGTLVQDVDRRGVFTFTETELLEPGTVAALALAARSSASFPIAFEPSFLPFTQGTPAAGKIPARPPMAPFANISRAHWVADGGLLDNRPIDVLLKRIFDRPARRPVRRVLLFVVPSSGPAPDIARDVPADDLEHPLGLVDGLLKDLSAITTQSIAADLRQIRAHQDSMAARTDGKLRLAELAAQLPEGARLLTPALLDDYRSREATRHAHDLTDALLRQLGTGVPKSWAAELAIGGDAEKVCRKQITESILSRRDAQPRLPLGPADLARYGQPGYDLAKSCALAVVRAAYQLATSDDDIADLTALTKGIHAACPPPDPVDSGALVRAVFAKPAVRQGSLKDAATMIAAEQLRRSEVPQDGWAKLGRVLVDGYPALKRLADKALPADDAAPGSPLALDGAAAGQLHTYLRYLRPATDPGEVATRLFDLAAAQRAMLPADADIDQSVELVQVSADTRSLLAPDWQTAQQKLTGMQFHHFGAFYKRSWRSNDWMWGRLDGAGWLVHVLLDPRRVRWVVAARPQATESGAKWFVQHLKALGAPDFPAHGYRLATVGGDSGRLTEDTVLRELAFVDNPAVPMPPSLPATSMWLAQLWQRRVLDEELDELAGTVLDPNTNDQPDWSPARSRTWAKKVLAAAPGESKYALLNEDPVARETFNSDRGSPLMAHTVAKAAATASGAVGSVRQLPGVVKPPIATVRTLTLAAYRVVSLTKGIAKRTLTAGAALLVLGLAAAVQSATLIGVTGLTMAGVGGYLIVLGTWQLSSRLLFALVSATLVGAVLSLATPVVRAFLFGDREHSGWIGTHAYWLGTQWWHPLLAVAAISLCGLAAAAAKPKRK